VRLAISTEGRDLRHSGSTAGIRSERYCLGTGFFAVLEI